jgi:hypothetical protein
MNINMYNSKIEKQKYNFMTQYEMKLRLDQGEDALDLSIEKWDRIYDALRLNESENKYDAVEVSYSETCALCKKYIINHQCMDCLYYGYYGAPCHRRSEHWGKWNGSSSLYSAKEMRDALIEIKHNPHKIIGVEYKR